MTRSIRNCTPRTRRHAFRPRLDALEQRALLSTITWSADVSGDWDNPAMWTGGAVPGPGDDAVISFSDISVTHNTSASDTVDSLNCAASLDISSGSLSIDTTSPSQPTSTVSGQFNLSGASLQLISGSLSLTDGGTISGTITAAAGTTLALLGQDLTSASVVSSAGSVELSGCAEAGTFGVAGGTSASNTSFTGTVVSLGSSLITFYGGPVTFAPAAGGPVTLTTGTLIIDSYSDLTGSDSFEVTGPMSINMGAELSTSGAVDAYGGLTIDGTGYVPTIQGTTLNNHGAATLETEYAYSIYLYQGATINNLANASFTITGTGGAILNSDDSAVAFNNAGNFTCDASGSFYMGQVPFANAGSVNVQHGALALGTATNSGTVTLSPGTVLSLSAYTQTAGSTVVIGATINGGPLSINGGSLTGTGTINAAVTNGGQVIPGGTGAAGTLNINANYTQTATGNLNIALGGTTAGSQYDQLAVSDTAALGGTVNVSLIDSFQPAVGNTFEPLTFASSTGSFGFYNGIILGNRLLLDPALSPTNLTLTVQPAVTTTTLAAPPSPSVSGQSVTFTATVTVALPPTTIDPVPTGTVTFYDNGTAIGTGTLGVVNGQDQASYATNTLSTASHAITAAYTSGDANFIPSAVSASVTQVVNKANTSATVEASPNPSVYGQSITITATVSVTSPGSTAVASPTGTVTFYDNGTSIGAGTLSVVSGLDQASLNTSALAAGSDSITAAYTSGGGNFIASPTSTAVTQTVNKDSTATSVSASPTFANVGQNVTITATVTANSPGSGTPTGTVDFYDTTTSTDLTPGGVSLSSGTATFSTTSLPAGSQTIKATYSGDGNFLTSYGTAGAVTIGQTIFVLDPSAGGALSLSGSASITISGGVYVDSISSSALSASGAPSIKASVIDVHGGVEKSGSPSFSPTPVTGAASVADPLASLPLPGTSGLTTYGAENVSGASSATIKPGIYSSISVSGSGALTMSAGTYLIEGGGFSISGAGSVTGSGVTIINAGSDYPAAGGTYGSISLSGSGTYKLTSPTTGTYAGIVIFQTRDNTKAMTVSGAASGMTGTIYASAAALTISGSGELSASLDVDTLTLSGAAVANAVTLNAPAGTVAYTPAQVRAGYGISSLALDGSGQTIAIVDAYDDPNIDEAVDDFDSQFGLTTSGPTLYDQYGSASSFLTVLNQYGQATSLPSTDPSGPGTDNWEVEESLDVEWAHAIAPGAQIILVEADSQSLSDLMASVATAASQPGVSVVSMSWGFAEGQAVFASDEARYDSVFNIPGVTFVASTGDYGTADPQYPAYSPNVVAVGGTSLTLNADSSYNNETGWGYYSDTAGAFIASGGGLSLYEPEPAYQQGVQSTGSRSTPDVSFVADPATGAWIADPYNLNPSDPFEVVGGTSLSAPAWAGLVALVDQGRAAAGESTLNGSSPTETQRALYMLPQSDYNVITSGTNGYTAGAGYNLVTGLGTPVANLLVPDLIAYQGPGTSYAGSPVAPLQYAGLVNNGASEGGPMDVFSVFDALALAGDGLGDAPGQVPGAIVSSPINVTFASAGAGRTATSPLIAAGITVGPATNLSPVGLTPLALAGLAVTPASTSLMSQQSASLTAQPMVNAPVTSENSVLLKRTDHAKAPVPLLTGPRAGLVPNSVLDDLVSDAVLVRWWEAPDAFDGQVALWDGVITAVPMAIDPVPAGAGFPVASNVSTGGKSVALSRPPREPASWCARLAVILLAAGSCGRGAHCLDARIRRMGRLHPRTTSLKITPRKV